MTKKRFARIITMRAKPGKGDEFLRRFRDGVGKTAVKIEGLRRLYLLRPVGKNDQFVTISLWDDEEAAENYAKSGRNKEYGEVLSNVQEGKERVKEYGVDFHLLGERTRLKGSY